MGSDGMTRRVLLVEDDGAHAILMRESLKRLSATVDHARTRAAAVNALEEGRFDVVVLDAGLPDGSGFEIQRWLRERGDASPIIFVTSDDLAEHAVEAVRAGAAHYVIKRPNYLEQMRDAVSEVLARSGCAPVPGGATGAERDTGLVGESPAMHAARRLIAQYGASEAPVIVSGETGTGKDLVARGLHAASRRTRGPFVAVNCAAIATALFESEMFGNVRGAYTGADRTREGLVGAARGGTLFLDEVRELPMDAQAKLLRVLEAGTYRPVGGSQELLADCRVIAASNRDLRAAIEDGRLRPDLYYRLAVLKIHLSPLRERRGDIAALVAHFVAQHSAGFEARRATPEALAQLMAHDWPGNVRELEHVVERTLVGGARGPIARFDLAPDAREGSGEVAVRALDADRLTALLAFHGGHLGPVAQELGTSVRTLQRRLKELGLRRGDFRGLGE